MTSKSFDKSTLQQLIWEEELNGLKVVEDTITGTTRWNTQHKLIFQEIETQKFYLTYYQIGATEMQDERPFENEGAEIFCEEVFAKEKIITVYERNVV